MTSPRMPATALALPRVAGGRLAGARARQDAGGDWPNTRRLLPWMLAAFVAMVWLVPFDAITLPIPLPLDGKLDRPVLGGLLLVWSLTLLTPSGTAGRPQLWFTWIHAWAAVLLLVVMAGAVMNVGSLVNLDEFTLVLKKLAVLLSFLTVLVIAGSAIRPAEVRPMISFMLGVACVAAAGVVVEYQLGYNVFYDVASSLFPGQVRVPADLGARDSTGRLQIYGPGGHPLETAALLGLALPFALVRMVDSRERAAKLLYAAVAALILAGAFATLRKTSVVAPAAGILVLVAYRPRPMLRHLVPFLLGSIVLVHLVAPGAMGSLFDQLMPGRLVGVLSTQDRAADFDGTRPDYASHLILGRGYQSYDPHKYRILDNEYLALFLGVGLVGLLAYLALLMAAGALAHAGVMSGDPLRGPPALAAASATGVMLVATALFDLLSYPHLPYMFFLIAGLIVAGARPRTPPRPALP